MNTPRGFIALLSVIIISVVLLLISTSGSLSGFYTRMNALMLENKERSRALAEACVDHTLLALAVDQSYAGGASTTVSGKDKCYTGVVSKTGSYPNTVYSFRTRAFVNDTQTVLSVSARESDFHVTSYVEEVAW